MCLALDKLRRRRLRRLRRCRFSLSLERCSVFPQKTSAHQLERKEEEGREGKGIDSNSDVIDTSRQTRARVVETRGKKSL